MTSSTIFVLNPTVNVSLPAGKLSPRPKELRGLVIGLLDNSKSNVDIFMARLEELLTEKFKSSRVSKRRTGGHRVEANAAKDSTEQLLDELAKECHVVINGIGD